MLSIVCPRAMELVMAKTGAGNRRQDPDRLPYWAEVWPVSVALARWVLRGQDLRNRRVLDFGCGVGTAGVAAGRRGARVTFADRDPEALRFAAFNAHVNGVAGFGVCTFDWHRAVVPGPFDLILAADVI
jgi:predicted nicotinamide N-methyase